MYIILLIFGVLPSLITTKLAICLDERYGFCNTTTELNCLQDSTVNCINHIENGLANITIASGNTAALASQLTTNLSIIGEFIDNREAVVVLISKRGNVISTKGLKYCHPGASNTEIAPWMLNEYRKLVVKGTGVEPCQNKSLTTIENDIYTWNSIFGPSCIPGSWAPDDELDGTLKKRYPKLTELCQYYQQGKDGLLQSLDCLVSNQGDVAVTSLAIAKSFMDKSPNTELYYVCKNGTTTESNNPCIWSSQSGTLILTNRNDIDNLLSTMRYEFPDVFSKNTMNNMTNQVHLTPSEKSFLDTVLFTNKTVHETDKTILKEYMEEIQGIPSSYENFCQRRFSWCTTTEKEYQKCLWMEKTAVSYDIELFECKLLKSDTGDNYECIEDIVQQKSAVTFIENKATYTAMKGGLKQILISKDPLEHMTRTLLVVDPTIVRTLFDFKQKNACFAQAFDGGFVSFVDTMKRHILTGDTCLYDEGLSKFVKSACIPGIRDKALKASGNIDFNSICQQCEPTPQSSTAVNCNANRTENLYAGNEGALSCLTNRKGDYAVITLDPRETENIILPKGSMVMCRNGSLFDTLEVDDDCYLSVIPAGGIVVEKKNKHWKDIQLALMGLAKVTTRASPPFNIFRNFQGENDLLFPNSLYDFVMPDEKISIHDDVTIKYVKRFTLMMELVDKCSIAQRLSPTVDPGAIKSATYIWIIVVVVVITIVAVAAIAAGYIWRRRTNAAAENANNSEELEEMPLQ